MKNTGIILMVVLYLGSYITILLKLFSSTGNDVHYIKNEMMFGSGTLVFFFILMTIVLLMYCNYFIGLFFIKKIQN